MRQMIRIKLSDTQGFFLKNGHLTLLQQIGVSTWGSQTVNRIDLAQNIYICDVVALLFYLQCDTIRHLPV